MFDADKIIKEHPEVLAIFLNELPGECQRELELMTAGYHFTEATLLETGIPIKYCYEDIKKMVSGLGINFPSVTTPEDLVFTVNYLYNTYYPLISDLPMAVRFAEKYIKDPEWPENDKPYRIHHDKNL